MATVKPIENPLLARLKRRSGVMARWQGLVGVTLLAGWVWYGFLDGMLSPTGGPMTFVGVILAFSTTVTLVPFLAWLASNFPLLYMRSAEHESVSATPLTNEQWMNAYIGTILYRSRALIWLAALLLPIAALVMPPFWTWPWPLPQVYTSGGFRLDQAPEMIYFTLLFDVGLLSLCYWIICLGVSVALRWREPVVAAVIALLVPAGVWLSAAVMLNNLTERLLAAWQLPWNVLWTAGMVAAPYGLARLCARLGQPWARGDH